MRLFQNINFEKVTIILTLLVLAVTPVFAQSDNPAMASRDLGFSVPSSVDIAGNKYIGFAGQLPSLQTLVGDDGTVSVAVNDAKVQKTYIYNYSADLKPLNRLEISDERAILGAFTRDSEGNYYIFFAENAGSRPDNMVMAKYDKAGRKINQYALNSNPPASMAGVQQPFAASTCRLELSGDLLAVYFGRLMFNGHQASYGFVLNKDSFERVDKGATTNPMDAGRKIMPYVSHSFNQFILPVKNGFLFADHGDAYPRCFAFAKWLTNNRLHRLQTFTFPGAEGENATYAEMGGLAKTKTGFLFCGAYGGGQNSPRNVFEMIIDKGLTTYKALDITAYRTNDGHAAHPKIVAIGNDRYVIMWELMTFSTQDAHEIVGTPTGYKSTWYAIVNGDGGIVTAPKQMPAGVRLNMGDVLRFDSKSGRVYWAVNEGSKGFALWSFDPTKAMNYKPNLALFNKSEKADASDFTWVKNGAGEISITKYKGSILNLIIPDTINGLPVTEIASGAFTYSSITGVTLPSTLKQIDDTSFWYSGIKKLDIPNGVTSICKQAFSFCKGLVSISIPKSVKRIEPFAFMGCPNLVTVKIDPDCDMTLGQQAFDQCPKLDAASKAAIGTY
jgi:hypothetical protein